MSTREFIERCVNGYQTTRKAVSSVLYENGVIYSYGYHYPLLIKTRIGWILNDRGYSNTTAKHINWARGFSIGSVNFYTYSPNDEGVIQSIIDEMKSLQDKKVSLSSRAWKQKEVIDERYKQLRELKAKFN